MLRTMPADTAVPTNRPLPIAHEATLASLSIALLIFNTKVRLNTRLFAEWHTAGPIARSESGVARIGHWTKLP